MTAMTQNPLVRLGELGQSPWLDFITRDLLRSGELHQLIVKDGLRGLTTNPTIFEKAVATSDLYDADIRALAAQGHTAAEIFEALAVADVAEACDAFQPLYQRSGGEDGFVSIEVSPELARDSKGTVEAARHLWRAVQRPNLMIKIPGTGECLRAIETCLVEGINVNVTLLFSVERYRDVIEAYITALEQRAIRREPLAQVASVASFFVSRVDSVVDKELDQLGTEQARALRGRIAVANARAAYRLFEQTFRGPRWQALVRSGARVQRPLWASTSTKDPAYPDVYYVEALAAPYTVNTLPPETLAAYRDHGDPSIRIHQDAGLEEPPHALAALGLDLARITRALEQDGIAKFGSSYAACLRVVGAKAAALSTPHSNAIRGGA